MARRGKPWAASPGPCGSACTARSTAVRGPHLLEIVRAFEEEHPSCGVEMVDIGITRDQLTWLRKPEVDVLATRMPLTERDVVIGPTLSREPRIPCQYRDGQSVIAIPARIALATGEGSEPSKSKPSGRWTAGWAIIRGAVPRWGHVAVCTMNGWHK